jgi:hypothetical protein
VRWDSQHRLDHSPPDEPPGHLVAVSLLNSHVASALPAWQRLSELAQDRQQDPAAAEPR